MKEYYTKDVKEVKDGEVIIEKRIKLPKGKTTTEGLYPKFKEGDECAFPERASCNYGEFFERCPHMKCMDVGKWICNFDKDETTNKKEK